MQKVLVHFNDAEKSFLVLGLALLVLTFFSFYLVGRPFVFKSSQLNTLKQKKITLDQAPGKLQILNRELASLTDSGHKPYDTNDLLTNFSAYCKDNQLRIESFPMAEHFEQDDLTLISQQIEVEGSFKKLLGLLYLLERTEKSGLINSAKFYTVKNRKTKRDALRLSFVLRNVLQKSSL